MNIALSDVALPIGVLTLSPAVDITYEISRLVANEKVHALSNRLDPGGNGLNVGRALKRLDTASHGYCVTAGNVGHLLQRLLAGQLDNVDYEDVAGETRINATAIEHTQQVQYEVCAIGPAIPPSQLDALLQRFVTHSIKGFGVLTGSLPQGISSRLYADVARRIRDGGGRAVVDAHDEALRYAIDARPFLIKPNRCELEALVGQSLTSLEAVATEARRLHRSGIDYVCISMGSDGALLVGPDNSYHATAPAVEVRSYIGAGDTMVAALLAAFARGAEAQEALRLAVACATGTVVQPGTELFSASDVDGYLKGVTVRSLDI